MNQIVEAVEGGLVFGWYELILLLLLVLLLLLLSSSALQERVDSVVRDEEKHAATRQDCLRVESNPWELKHIRPSNAVSWVLHHELAGSDGVPEKLEAAAWVDQS